MLGITPSLREKPAQPDRRNPNDNDGDQRHFRKSKNSVPYVVPHHPRYILVKNTSVELVLQFIPQGNVAGKRTEQAGNYASSHEELLFTTGEVHSCCLTLEMTGGQQAGAARR
jgi:hypothetical protein